MASVVALPRLLSGRNVGGWVNQNWKQLYKQFAYVLAVTAYVFVVTAALAKLFDLIPFLNLRATEQGEIIGMDEYQVSAPHSQSHLGTRLTNAL